MLSESTVVSAPKPLKQQHLFQVLAVLGILFGVLVRLVQYLHRRSLWEDEANLALNIVNRSYLELLQPLDYNQAAPPLFLWIEKAAVQVFGNSEYALRLFPFICGILALVGFYQLAKRYTTALAAPIAVILFACLKYILYYGNEVKQYSSDLMVSVTLCLLLIPLRHQILNRRQLLGLGLLGAAFIWLSHPAIFVMAGIEVGYFLVATRPQRRDILVNRLPLYLIWLISFAALYALTIQGTLENQTLAESWIERYPRSPLDLVWLFDAFGRFFYNPLGFLGVADGIAILPFALGCIAYYRRDRLLLLAILAPIVTTLIAACLKQYPFRERLVIFLTPLAILIIAQGIASLFTLSKQWRKPGFFVGILLLFALVTPPFLRSGRLMIYPTEVEEMRPVLAYVKSQQQPSDRLYVYRSGLNQFIYYAPTLGYAADQYKLGKSLLAEGGGKKLQSKQGVKQFKREVKSLQGESRVWFVFCRASEVEEQAFLSTIASLGGQQLDQVHQTGAMAYLYQMNVD
ncbi:MAG: glycosyltransferase family 39 protein [Pegethrix bostrychoides GSE-TBD4-15B]|jgi:hypothetical protein|uniref:Glycosyltransferase family 39 protein n=1 Tax=Pegethrix bostrychoides GSE-TBD4-15B TaxID=2839662 RepID=A0A951PE88_9CYAN|nr:glycosyltransferase family 39 protein [Pegethrix bostrychoides GSE-TBD4-15B]